MKHIRCTTLKILMCRDTREKSSFSYSSLGLALLFVSLKRCLIFDVAEVGTRCGCHVRWQAYSIYILYIIYDYCQASEARDRIVPNLPNHGVGVAAMMYVAGELTSHLRLRLHDGRGSRHCLCPGFAVPFVWLESFSRGALAKAKNED